jgi:hypothetical protein
MLVSLRAPTSKFGSLTIFKQNISLLIRYHIVDSNVPDDLMRTCLLQLCAYHLDVRPLLSGKSGVVSGEVHRIFS